MVAGRETSWGLSQEWQRGTIGKRLPRMSRSMHDELCEVTTTALLAITETRRVAELLILDHRGGPLLSLTQSEEWSLSAVEEVLNSLEHTSARAILQPAPTEPPLVAQRREFLRLIARFGDQRH